MLIICWGGGVEDWVILLLSFTCVTLRLLRIAANSGLCSHHSPSVQTQDPSGNSKTQVQIARVDSLELVCTLNPVNQFTWT